MHVTWGSVNERNNLLTTAFIIMIVLSVLRGFGVLLGFAQLANGNGDATEWVVNVVICALLLFVAVAIGTVV